MSDEPKTPSETPKAEVAAPAAPAPVAPVDPSALPAPTDVAELRKSLQKATTSTAAVDAVVRWAAGVLQGVHGAAGSARATFCVRVQRPSGALRVARLLVGEDPVEVKNHFPRTSLQPGAARGDLVCALRDHDRDCGAALLAPVQRGSETWGALGASVCDGDPNEVPVLRIVAEGARALESWLARQTTALARSVVDHAPRTPLAWRSFVQHVSGLLASRPEGVVILAYALPARLDTSGDAKSTVRKLASLAVEATRAEDAAGLLGEDAFALALPMADPSHGTLVADRVRSRIARWKAEEALGGFAQGVAKNPKDLAPEAMAALLAAARANVLLRS